MDPDRRRSAIARLIRSKAIGTQEELAQALFREGYDVTQATLSRDLARLGARRATRPDGGSAYELPDEPAPGAGDAALEALRGLVLLVESNGSLVVIRTQPGGAGAVARWVDLSKMDDVLGTLAGDDTIFVAPAREGQAKGLARRLAKLFGIAE